MRWILVACLIGCGAAHDHGAGDDDDDGGTGSGSGSNPGGVNDSCGGLSRPWLATGQGPTGIVSGDFDRDGVIDLAVTNTMDKSVSVMRGLGGGRFAPKVDYPAWYLSGLAVADFDHDGKLDLVTGYDLLLGNDDGSFQSPADFSIGDGLDATGDFDGDGNADVVSASTELYITRGRGDGTFLPYVSYPLDAAAVAIVAVDLNGDGKLDVVVGEQDVVDVFLGHGDGTFDGKLSYPMHTTGYIAIGDVSGDGIPDLVVPGDPAASVLPGMGNGSFGTAHVLATQFTNGSQHVALIDVDQNGTLDIVVGDGWNAEVVASHGDGTYGMPSGLYYEASTPRAWLATDLDGDGQPDLALAGYAADAVGILFADHGKFVAPRQFATAAGSIDLALVDMNGDQHLDAVVATDNAATVSVLVGVGDGTFATKRDAAGGGRGFSVQDVDGDGRLDVVGGSGLGLDVLRGKGDGSLMPKQSFMAASASTLVAADFTSDGKPDVIAKDGDQLALLTNAGDGTFPTATNVSFAGYPSYILAAPDLDGNGTPDLVIAATGCSGNTGALETLAGNGAGGFQLLDTISLAHCATGIATADLDHDGKLDLVVAENIIYPYIVPGQLVPVEVFLGSGGGHFHPAVAYLADVYPEHVAIADVDGDGALDLVVSGYATEVLHGRSDGTFGPRTPYGAPAASIVAGDVDGDGSMDLVATSAIGIQVMLGTCH